MEGRIKIYNRDTGNIDLINLFHHIPVNDVEMAADMDLGIWRNAELGLFKLTDNNELRLRTSAKRAL